MPNKYNSPIALPINTLPLWILLVVLVPVSLNLFIGAVNTFATSFAQSFSNTDSDTIDILSGFSVFNLLQLLLFFAVVGAVLWVLSIVKASHITKWYVQTADQHKLKSRGIGESIRKLSRWKMYKWFKILLPLFCTELLVSSIGFIWINAFNIIAAIAGKNLEFVITLATFTGLISLFILGLASLYSLWIAINTCYGDIIAVVEPQLNNATIHLRSQKLAFQANSSSLTYFIYIAAVLFIGAQILLYILFGLAGKNIPFIFIIGLELVDILGVMAIYHLLTKNYYQSVLIYLKNISSNI